MTASLSPHPDAVAIIGMAARLPGAPDLRAYWLNLREGVESITRHTHEEMLSRGVSPDLLANSNYVPASATLTGGDCFDSQFFNYSAREAALMDPQHRVFLECAYHALEDAGYDSYHYDDTIGVYAGCTMNTYLLYNVMSHADDVVAAMGDLSTMVGNDKDFLSTRVSHRLDLRGPSLTVQTACSSSLVAVHLAVRALVDGECGMALAGGASVRMPYGGGYLANPGGTSAPDGHCRAFDAAAAGSVLGNGVGAVVLKRLTNAQRDGDQIYGVIRGSAINNDGAAKASFTAPSVEGQSRAMVRALDRAGVSARDIAFVEAHGTGTPLGDPIEVAALTRAFRRSTDDREYCWLGSVKPNIGHLDAAAGIAGLIKAVLALRHRQVPPVVNFHSPNPKLTLDQTPFRVPTELTPLDSEGPLLASVNSLAMGGTNAHVILEEAPPVPAAAPSARRRHLIPLSARSPEALDEMSRALGQWARENPAASVADVGYTLAVGRPELEYRRTVAVTNLEDIVYTLSVGGSPRQRSGHHRGPGRSAFLFPGQGTQRVDMGAALARHDRTFATHLEAVLDLFRDTGSLDVRPVLYPAVGEADDARAQLAGTDLTQASLFAVEWALGQTLLDYGIRPHAMMGHSIGEIVAATLAGVMSVPDAVRLVTIRGQALRDTPDGAMLYVNLPAGEVAARLVDTGVVVAAVNAPALTVVSGSASEIATLADRLRSTGVTFGALEVTRAFHSPLVEPAADRVRVAVADIDLCAPRTPVVSNVTGRFLTAEQATSADYWAEQVRRPVLFAEGARTLADDGVVSFVEVGPGHALTSLVRAGTPDASCVPVLDDPDAKDLVDVLGSLWLQGVSFDAAGYYRGEERRRVSLPLYPFARTRHWLDSVAMPRTTSAPVRAEAATVLFHPVPTPPEARLSRLEQYLVGIWRDLLGVERIEAQDSFFDLDGTSLLAMQLVSRLRQDGASELELTSFFERPTVAALAGHLESLGFSAPANGAPVRNDRPPAPAEEQSAAEPATDPAFAMALAEVAALTDDEVRARLAELDGLAHVDGDPADGH